MTGDDFVTLAGRLFAGSLHPSEPLLRTVISRAYYGAFHICSAYFRELGLPIPSDHGEVWKRLSQSGHPIAVLVGRRVQSLHRARVAADYRLDAKDPARSGFAKAQIELAVEVQSLLYQCREKDAASAIRAGIDAYLKRIGAAHD
ncbi:MAG TPA: hypothetical protein VMP01_17085 [Pirellulaceae bacterium]|nr:hypothetical protein [Pirellulaceae bacterium]